MPFHFVQQGHGPSVVLIHGLFGDKDNLAGLSRALLEQGFEVIRIDLPNHGQSPQMISASLAQISQALEQLRQQLAIKRWGLVGHSFGGKVAMSYAQAYPQQTQALVVADIAPVAYPRRHDEIFNALLSLDVTRITSRKQALNHLLEQGIDGATCAFLIKSLKTQAGGGFAWQWQLETIINNYPHIIGALPENPPYNGPTRFIKGELSQYLLPQHQAEVLRRFPQAQARVITGAGHWLHAEKPALFNRLVLQFLLPYFPELSHSQDHSPVL